MAWLATWTLGTCLNLWYRTLGPWFNYYIESSWTWLVGGSLWSQITLAPFTLCCVVTLLLCRNMYIHIDELSEILHKYFLYRCRNSILFSLKVILQEVTVVIKHVMVGILFLHSTLCFWHGLWRFRTQSCVFEVIWTLLKIEVCSRYMNILDV